MVFLYLRKDCWYIFHVLYDTLDFFRSLSSIHVSIFKGNLAELSVFAILLFPEPLGY